MCETWQVLALKVGTLSMKMVIEYQLACNVFVMGKVVLVWKISNYTQGHADDFGLHCDWKRMIRQTLRFSF